jgi:lipopolysaccharide transport system permease protein
VACPTCRAVPGGPPPLDCIPTARSDSIAVRGIPIGPRTMPTSSPRRNSLELVLRMALTDLKLRYQGSVLGFLWTLLKPLMQFAVLYIVFSVFMRIKVENYQLYLLLGILIWNYIAEGTTHGMLALPQKANIIKKVYFPRIFVVVSTSLHHLFALLLSLVVFFVFFFAAGKTLPWTAPFLVVSVALLYTLVLGLSLVLSVLHLKFRDTSQIWEVMVMAGFFLSPVIYPLDVIPAQYHTLLFLNPITGLIQYARLLVLEGQLPSLAGALYVTLISGGILALGIWLFNRHAHLAAEEL